jgi:hypothetical protein
MHVAESILRRFAIPPKLREGFRSAGNPSRGECPAQLDEVFLVASSGSERFGSPASLAKEVSLMAGANRSPVAEGDFQRPARQLTPSACEREITLGSIGSILDQPA